MTHKIILNIAFLAIIMFSCNNAQKDKAQPQVVDTTATTKLMDQKKPFTSTHIFNAIYDGTKFHKCLGMTANCPEKCGSSGNMATFKVTNYKEFLVNGQAGNEKLTEYSVLISDYYQKDLDKPYVPVIKSLKKGEEVIIHLEFVYDTTQSTVSTVENLISITPNDNSTVSKVDNKDWWVGKRFVNDRVISKNPEEGGPDFMVIHPNHTAEYKVGDMAMTATWSVSNDVLTLELQLGGKIEFNIKENSLVDGYKTIWKINK